MCLGSRPGCWTTVIYIILANSYMLLELVRKGTLRTRRLSLALPLPFLTELVQVSSITVTARMEESKQLRELKTLSP